MVFVSLLYSVDLSQTVCMTASWSLQFHIPWQGSLGTNLPKLDYAFTAHPYSWFCFIYSGDCLMSQCPHLQLCWKDGLIVLSRDDHGLSMDLPWVYHPPLLSTCLLVCSWLLTLYGSSHSCVCLIPCGPTALTNAQCVWNNAWFSSETRRSGWQHPCVLQGKVECCYHDFHC